MCMQIIADCVHVPSAVNHEVEEVHELVRRLAEHQPSKRCMRLVAIDANVELRHDRHKSQERRHMYPTDADEVARTRPAAETTTAQSSALPPPRKYAKAHNPRSHAENNNDTTAERPQTRNDTEESATTRALPVLLPPLLSALTLKDILCLLCYEFGAVVGIQRRSLADCTRTCPVAARSGACFAGYATKHDMVSVVETRGTAGDIAHLPGTHVWHGTFAPHDIDASTTRAGGVVIGVSRDMQRRWECLEHVTLARGRALAIRFYRHGRVVLLFIAVHLYPALAGGSQLSLFGCIREAMCVVPGALTIVGGDWNFVLQDEGRMRSGRAQPRDSGLLFHRFDSILGR